MVDFVNLEYSELTPAAQQVLPQNAPLAAKMVAARAMLPLMSRDLVYVLYYLSFDPDQRVAQTASESLIDLPDSILLPVLKDNTTSEKVLSYVGIKGKERELVVEAITLNRNTPDNVFAEMARVCVHDRLIDIFAANQIRILRHPQIIASLSKNPLTPRSIIDRAETFYKIQTGRDYKEDIEPDTIPTPPEPEPEQESVEPELATDTSQLLDDTIPDTELELEEPASELIEDESIPLAAESNELLKDELPPDFKLDDLFKEDFGQGESLPEEFLVDPEAELTEEKRESLENRIRKMKVMDKLRLGMTGNIEARNILIKSSNKMIQECVVRNPQITIDEVIRISRNKTMREEIIRLLTQNREWVRNYQVRINLVWNPKTPMTFAMKALSGLNKKDLEKLGKSKQVPGMLAVTARKALSAKQRYD